MAIDLGISQERKRKLVEILLTSHRIEVGVELMNLSHKYEADLSKRLLGGQVDIDATATEATRSLTMELLDPAKELALDGWAPDDGSIYFTKQIKIIYSVISLDRADRFDIPIFCGPITKAERNGVVVSVTGMGKEKLAQSQLWKSKTYKSKAKKIFVMKHIMVNLGGEKPAKVNIEGESASLPKKLTLDRDNTAWDTVQRIAKSMSGGKFVFYDGRGVCNLRGKNRKVQFTFKEKGALLSSPTCSFDAENVVNCVEVIGGKPRKNAKRIRYKAVAPKKHILSPKKMGRFGNARFLPITIQDDSIKSKKEAKRVARSTLKRLMAEQIEVAFEALPIPFLEENDWCAVESEQYTGQFRLQKMSIPLTAGSASSIGYLKKVTPNKRQIKLKNIGKKKNKRRDSERAVRAA